MRRRISKPSEDEEILLKAIRHLSDVQASLIILHYLKNASLGDVGQKLKLSDNEVSIQHHFALSALRRWMYKFNV
jgi:DNA-directed RNA polymerase specialized sigma24 family protein